MRSLLPSAALCLLFAATPATAQRMGSVNANVPTVGCYIQYPNGTKLEVSYYAITLAQGRFMRAIKDPEKAQGYRRFLNRMADSNPLGRLSLTAKLALGGKNIAKGDYDLAFKLDEDLKWHLVLTNQADKDVKHDWKLNTKAPKASAKRLTMSLVPGDKDGEADFTVQFGEVRTTIPVGKPLGKPVKAEQKPDSRPASRPDSRRRQGGRRQL